ncbi:uncharacterized protein LOC130088295 isoform X2 [Rhinichthys klamathensis goyatoka]|uniref:uncharacterized protein LOC130088295 isoform X2 n=1 Tax=Rhinichthys klamathensis goyatoka TaxID=3034132 RepID=UPI0024B53E91|nr:uncharacterized protein LOC130088295 isoform X2 [Rhinichthys klamathensis goyatoka]
MDMAKHVDNRHSRQENIIDIVERFLCCSCFRTVENDCLEYNQEKPQNPKPVVDEENVHVVVEDLGIDNPGFSLAEVKRYGPPQQITIGRSASSVSVCQRAALKKKLAPLSSLPFQCRVIQNNEDDSAVDSLLYGSGSINVEDGGLLTPPVINLIPPTPSDVIDDDQFFDINSEEESLQQTSGSEGVDSIGSAATGEQEREEDVDQDVEFEGNRETKTQEHPQVEPQEEDTTKKNSVDKSTIHFLRSSFQVPPLPEYPRKRSLNTGISLLQFTEHNLDDLSNKDASSHELLKEELRLLPLSSKISMLTHQKKLATRYCSLDNTVSRCHTFHSTCQGQNEILEDDESPRQRRITVASYIPQSMDHTGESAVKDSNGYSAKTLAGLNTEEVCQWFSNIGLQKCLPFIREAEFSGSQIASIDLHTLEILQLSNLEERERLLSAIYHELHPPNATTQRLNSLLERFGPHNVEKFTAALVSMTKSKSSPQVSSINMNRCSFKFRQKEQNARFQKNSHLIEITVNASERTVHLRTPKDTSVGKVMESCLRMLGINEDKDHFKMRSNEDEFSPEQPIGDLPGSETRLMELHLCRKKDGPGSPNNVCTADDIQSKNLLNNTGKIRELNQQVASLQNVIIQVQELYHGLVAFCSELKKMEGDMDAVQTDSLEVKRHLSEAQDSLKRKRQSLQTLRDNLNTAPVQKNKPSEVRLLEKMRGNCQVFKDEITLVHLNRQVAHLREVLEKTQAKEKAERKSPTLTQLVSLQSPVMLVATQVKADSDGHYGFSAHWVEGQGLMVVHTEGTSLCRNDRLVEVNGVSVLGSSEDELELLLKTHIAHIIVLRQLAQELPQEDPSGLNDHQDMQVLQKHQAI